MGALGRRAANPSDIDTVTFEFEANTAMGLTFDWYEGLIVCQTSSSSRRVPLGARLAALNGASFLPSDFDESVRRLKVARSQNRSLTFEVWKTAKQRASTLPDISARPGSVGGSLDRSASLAIDTAEKRPASADGVPNTTKQTTLPSVAARHQVSAHSAEEKSRVQGEHGRKKTREAGIGKRRRKEKIGATDAEHVYGE